MDFNKKMAILTVFISVLIGIVLLRPIVDNVDRTTETQFTENESFYLSAPNLIHNISKNNVYGYDIVCTNDSGQTLTTPRDYNLSANSSLQFGTYNGTTNCSYYYEDDDYVSDGTSRNLLTLIPIFFVLAIVLITVGYSVYFFNNMNK